MGFAKVQTPPWALVQTEQEEVLCLCSHPVNVSFIWVRFLFEAMLMTEGMLVYNPMKLDLVHYPFKAEGIKSN